MTSLPNPQPKPKETLMSRLFDPVNILNAEIGENATRRDPLPMGEVIAQITKIGITSDEIKKGDRKGEMWHRLDATLEITDPEYCARYGDGSQSRIVTTYGIMYDANEQGLPKLGPNVNVKLGRFRDAAGVNGRPLSALVGQFVRISVIHKPHTDPALAAEGVVLDEITGATKV